LELISEQKINASREEVFAALNDPEILQKCIPGCETLERKSERELVASVVLRIGPIKAKFKGQIELSNLVPPESYSISGKGSGGTAGFAKGGADIKLVEDGGGTLLQYKVKADLGGRLAQLGGRLLDSTAKTLSKQFFEKFRELVETAGDTAVPAVEGPPEPARAAGKPWIWIGAGMLALGAVVLAVLLNL
jgi:carbon monoxide dehydrogenase subunit G